MPWQAGQVGATPTTQHHTTEPGGPAGCPQARLRPPGAAEREAHVTALAATPSPTPSLWPWVGGAGLMAVGVSAAFLLEHFRREGVFLPPHAATIAPGLNATGLNATVLAWPAGAIALILAAYFALRYLSPAPRDAHRFWHIANEPK